MTVTVTLPYTKMCELCDKSIDRNCCTGISSQVTRGQIYRQTYKQTHTYHIPIHFHLTFTNPPETHIVLFILASRLTNAYQSVQSCLIYNVKLTYLSLLQFTIQSNTLCSAELLCVTLDSERCRSSYPGLI
jgi:hypothetical protein